MSAQSVLSRCLCVCVPMGYAVPRNNHTPQPTVKSSCFNSRWCRGRVIFHSHLQQTTATVFEGVSLSPVKRSKFCQEKRNKDILGIRNVGRIGRTCRKLKRRHGNRTRIKSGQREKATANLQLFTCCALAIVCCCCLGKCLFSSKFIQAAGGRACATRFKDKRKVVHRTRPAWRTGDAFLQQIIVLFITLHVSRCSFSFIHFLSSIRASGGKCGMKTSSEW